jgi:hypothetical protein
MEALTKKQKQDLVMQYFEKSNYTAYTISQNTNLTEAGVRKIVNGSAKNPHENTLNELIRFFEKENKAKSIYKEEPPNVQKDSNYNLNDCLFQNQKLTTIIEALIQEKIEINLELKQTLIELGHCEKLLEENNIDF